MSRRLLINPDYNGIRDTIIGLADNFGSQGEIIYRGHNLIKVADAAGRRFNIKRYRVPHPLNRVIYTFFRSPKGRRAFEYPRRLEAAGIDTPTPVAYIEDRRNGLIAYSYLITLQSPLSRTFYEFGDKSMTDATDVRIVRALTRFAARMHDAGILHRDFSPGNILFDLDRQGNPVFSIVDINRMKFGRITPKDGIRNFARLWGQPAMFDIIADEYALARGGDAAEMRSLLHAARRKFWTRYSRRHKIKYNLRFAD